MNYELAKELKEAGFPQNHECIETTHGNYCYKCESALDDFGNPYDEAKPRYLPLDDRYKEKPCIPTLPELIEACGQCVLMVDKGGATGASSGIEGQGGKRRDGDTPEEAVARLWLELNKK